MAEKRDYLHVIESRHHRVLVACGEGEDFDWGAIRIAPPLSFPPGTEQLMMPEIHIAPQLVGERATLLFYTLINPGNREDNLRCIDAFFKSLLSGADALYSEEEFIDEFIEL